MQKEEVQLDQDVIKSLLTPKEPNYSRKSKRAQAKIQAKLQEFVSAFFNFRFKHEDKNNPMVRIYRKELDHKWRAWARKWELDKSLMKKSDKTRPDPAGFKDNIDVLLPKMEEKEKQYAKVKYDGPKK